MCRVSVEVSLHTCAHLGGTTKSCIQIDAWTKFLRIFKGLKKGKCLLQEGRRRLGEVSIIYSAIKTYQVSAYVRITDHNSTPSNKNQPTVKGLSGKSTNCEVVFLKTTNCIIHSHCSWWGFGSSTLQLVDFHWGSRVVNMTFDPEIVVKVVHYMYCRHAIFLPLWMLHGLVFYRRQSSRYRLHLWQVYKVGPGCQPGGGG